MTNPAAAIPLTYASTDVQQNPIGIFLEVYRGINELPSIRGTDTLVPGLVGRIARNRITDRLEIELRGYVAGVGLDESAQRANFRSLVQVVQTLFDPTSTADLVATLEDGSTATIAARTLNLVWDQIVPSMARLSVLMESVAPAWSIEPLGS